MSVNVQYCMQAYKPIAYKRCHVHYITPTLFTNASCILNKKGQLSLTNPRDACETFAQFM